MESVRVWAVEGHPGVPYRNERGELVPGRHVARDPAGAPLPAGEEVAQTVDVLRDLRRGHLTAAPPVDPAAQE